MSHAQLHFSLDAIAGTALLILYVGGVEVTRYAYSAGSITLSALVSDVTVSFHELESNIGQITRWTDFISSELNPTVGARPATTLEFEFESNSIKGKFSINGPAGLISDAEFDDTTQSATFKSRTQKVLTWDEFILWAKFLKHFTTFCTYKYS